MDLFSLHLLAELAPAWPPSQLSYLLKSATSNLNLCFPGLATPWEESILVSYCFKKKSEQPQFSTAYSKKHWFLSNFKVDYEDSASAWGPALFQVCSFLSLGWRGRSCLRKLFSNQKQRYQWASLEHKYFKPLLASCLLISHWPKPHGQVWSQGKRLQSYMEKGMDLRRGKELGLIIQSTMEDLSFPKFSY